MEYCKLLFGQPFPFDSYERLVEKYRSSVDYRIMRKVPYCLCTHLNFTWLKFFQSKVILLVELLKEVRRKVIVLLTDKFSHHLLILSTILKGTPRVPCDCVPNFPFKAYFCYNRQHPFLSDRFLQKLSCLNDFQIRVLQYFLLGVHCFPVSEDTTRRQHELVKNTEKLRHP